MKKQFGLGPGVAVPRLKPQSGGLRTITLKEVAEHAGVTPMTVSNVLNRRTGEVSADTRERVMAAVETLGYRPNAIARRLRSRRTFAIGMLILDDVPEFLNDPFTTQVVAGLSNFASDHGYSVVLQGVRSSTLQDAPLIAQVQTDGICALLSGPQILRQSLIRRLVALGLPLVLLQESSTAPGICAIRQDDRGGAATIAKHVLTQGARRIAMLLPDEEWPAMTEREAGVRGACQSAGADLQIVRCGDESVAATLAALSSAIGGKPSPDAIIGGNDRMAMAALQWLAARNIEVPRQVKVTGFNGFDFAAYAVPKLTTVRSSAYEMGWRAGKELLGSFSTGSFSHSEIVLPVEFIQGQSG